MKRSLICTSWVLKILWCEMEASSQVTEKPLFSIQAKNSRNSPRGKNSPKERTAEAAKVLQHSSFTSSSASLSPKKAVVLAHSSDEDEKEDPELIGLCHPPLPESDEENELRKRLTGIDLAELENNASTDNP